MRSLILSVLVGAALLSPLGAKDGKWVKMFDGKSLNNWKATDNPESWTVKDGMIVGDGERSHLMYTAKECTNCEFKAKIKLNHGGNSGMFFRSDMGTPWPKGYEAQVDNTHRDPIRTGSLYNFVKVTEQLVPDDTWWDQEIRVEGNHIVIKVNGKTTVDFVDEKNTYQKGYLGLQQHNKGSVVMYKDIYMRDLGETTAKK